MLAYWHEFFRSGIACFPKLSVILKCNLSLPPSHAGYEIEKGINLALIKGGFKRNLSELEVPLTLKRTPRSRIGRRASVFSHTKLIRHLEECWTFTTRMVLRLEIRSILIRHRSLLVVDRIHDRHHSTGIRRSTFLRVNFKELITIVWTLTRAMREVMVLEFECSLNV